MLLVKHSLLDLHLHLDNFSLKIAIDFSIGLPHQLTNVLLPKNTQKLVAVGYFKMLEIVIEESLEEGPCKQPDPIDLLVELLQEKPHHPSSNLIGNLVLFGAGFTVDLDDVDHGRHRLFPNNRAYVSSLVHSIVFHSSGQDVKNF